jgi:cyclohexanone monooxygenase
MRRAAAQVCIIGGGYGGLCAGARLVEAGIDPESIRIVDKAGDVGGTWVTLTPSLTLTLTLTLTLQYWNRYPGAMCDVESYVYMPFCEEMGYEPTQKYAQQPELLAHSQLMAQRYGLYKKACFGAHVTAMEWDEGAGMWTIQTNAEDKFR